jgi:hypothetical protein
VFLVQKLTSERLLPEMFLSEVQHGSCDAAASPEVLNETAATAWVEGNNGLGPVVGSFCMNLAIDKAKNLGVGLVACKGSNHFGIGTTYVIQALKKDLVGLCFSNTSPVVAPTRARCVMFTKRSRWLMMSRCCSLPLGQIHCRWLLLVWPRTTLFWTWLLR